MTNRRAWLKTAAGAGTAALATALPLPGRSQPGGLLPPIAPTPNEGLMQEHGLVARVILIYQRAIDLAADNRFFHPDAVAEAAQVVARVIHGHHEVEEEEYLFPVLEKPPELNMLIAVLRGQHRAARDLTNRIGLEIADPGLRPQVFEAMREFARMYTAHGAYEDTIVYPAFRQALGRERYLELSDVFARRELALRSSFGDYARTLAEVEEVFDLSLAAYTAPLGAAVRGR